MKRQSCGGYQVGISLKLHINLYSSKVEISKVNKQNTISHRITNVDVPRPIAAWRAMCTYSWKFIDTCERKSIYSTRSVQRFEYFNVWRVYFAVWRKGNSRNVHVTLQRPEFHSPFSGRSV